MISTDLLLRIRLMAEGIIPIVQEVLSGTNLQSVRAKRIEIHFYEDRRPFRCF